MTTRAALYRAASVSVHASLRLIVSLAYAPASLLRSATSVVSQVGTGADRSAIRRERRRLLGLHEARVAPVAACADGELVREAADLPTRRPLQCGAVRCLIDRRAVVRRRIRMRDAGVGIRFAEIVVDVAAEIRIAKTAVVHVRIDQLAVAEKAAALGNDEREPVLVRVGIGVRVAGPVEERKRQRLRAIERVVGERHADIQVGLVVLESDLAEELPDAARIVQCPAVVIREVACCECVETLAGVPILEFERTPAERAAGKFDGASRILRTAFRVDRERTAQRIQAERGHRSRDQLDAGNGGARQQVPVDDVAECLVDPHAVLEHRHALRRAEQRRRREAAKVERLLERIALTRGSGDAIRVEVEKLRQGQRPRAGEQPIVEDLNVRRNVA